MKRFSILLLAVLLLLPISMLSGCNQKVSNDKISVVCTIFPQYDWVRQILGDKADNIELTLLLDKKVDLHSYQPSVEDIAKISACNLFIYVGGESDQWADDVLPEAINKEMVVINLLDILGDAAKAEEIIVGMEEEDHDHEDEEDHEGEAEYDEHIWLSLKNAQILCTAIANAVSSLDADNAAIYQSNLTAYNEKLSALDSEYQTAADDAPVKTLLFGDRFPFRYLVDDYSLDYYAAFIGCSAETEANFTTIIFLAQKADELGLKNIMVTESSDGSIAKTIINNTTGKNQKILVMDAMQSVTKSDVQNGTTYLSVMENNLNILKEALK
jgi:zinc transport system substrate-binding protein